MCLPPTVGLEIENHCVTEAFRLSTAMPGESTETVSIMEQDLQQPQAETGL